MLCCLLQLAYLLTLRFKTQQIYYTFRAGVCQTGYIIYCIEKYIL